MRRKTFMLAIASVVLLSALIAVSAPLLRGWTGDREHRDLAVGDSVTLESGLTFTVPRGWQGFYSRYYWFPAWLPIGERAGGLDRCEYLLLRPIAATGTVVMAESDQSDAVLRKWKAPALAHDAVVTVYEPQGPSHATVVETRLPGSLRGSVFFSSPGDTIESVQGEWSRLGIRGSSLPR